MTNFVLLNLPCYFCGLRNSFYHYSTAVTSTKLPIPVLIIAPVPCPVHTVPSPCELLPGKPAPELCIASADICDQMQDCNREAMISDGRIGRDELGCNRGEYWTIMCVS